MRYKITIQYNGTNFAGWQKQPRQFTVQGELEKAIQSFSKKKTEVPGSGRTDAGVHALGQVAHFDLEKKYDEYKVLTAINFFLRKQWLERIIKIERNFRVKLESLKNSQAIITKCEIVNSDFHARFSAKKRYYEYTIVNQRNTPLFEQNQVWHIKEKLDVQKMQEAANCLIGKHDFSSFRDSDCQSTGPIKTVYEAKFTKQKNKIIFKISAPSFLHHMVRNIMGTLKNVGTGKTSIKEFEKILKAKDRTKAGANASACGLFLMKVDY